MELDKTQVIKTFTTTVINGDYFRYEFAFAIT